LYGAIVLGINLAIYGFVLVRAASRHKLP
jgi:hypothetical protein